MANICENRFYFNCNKNFEYYVQEFKALIGNEPGQLEGDLLGECYNNSDDDASDGGWLEGYFDSKWSFPMHKFENMFNLDDEPYFRCISEEYGCGYVAMNIFDGNGWRPEQTFDL